MGRLPDGAGYVFASESCALDSIGAEFVRDVEPGEIVVADENGIQTIRTHCGQKSSMCVFEFIYFARPDSVIEGASVHRARLRAGHYLALEHPVQADVVIGWTADLTLRSGSLSRAVSPTASASSRTAT